MYVLYWVGIVLIGCFKCLYFLYNYCIYHVTVYSIVRQSDYVYNIANQVYKIDNNYKNYKFKINKLIENNDVNNLTKLLYTITQKFSSNNKFILLFLNCLFHFSLIILNETNDKKNLFLQKYFNFNHCNYPIIYNNYFFGINTSTINSNNDNNDNDSNDTNNVKLNIIETIMKQDYFDGLSQIESSDTQNSGNILYYCINENCFEYLSLISNYFDKNFFLFKNGINFYGSLEHPLLLLLQSNKMNNNSNKINISGILAGAMLEDESDIIARENTFDAIRAVQAAEQILLQDNKKEFLKLYLNLSEKTNELIGKVILKKALGLCKYILNGDVYSTMIQDYMIRCKISNDSDSDF